MRELSEIQKIENIPALQSFFADISESQFHLLLQNRVKSIDVATCPWRQKLIGSWGSLENAAVNGEHGALRLQLWIYPFLSDQERNVIQIHHELRKAYTEDYFVRRYQWSLRLNEPLIIPPPENDESMSRCYHRFMQMMEYIFMNSKVIFIEKNRLPNMQELFRVLVDSKLANEFKSLLCKEYAELCEKYQQKYTIIDNNGERIFLIPESSAWDEVKLSDIDAKRTKMIMNLLKLIDHFDFYRKLPQSSDLTLPKISLVPETFADFFSKFFEATICDTHDEIVRGANETSKKEARDTLDTIIEMLEFFSSENCNSVKIKRQSIALLCYIYSCFDALKFPDDPNLVTEAKKVEYGYYGYSRSARHFALRYITQILAEEIRFQNVTLYSEFLYYQRQLYLLTGATVESKSITSAVAVNLEVRFQILLHELERQGLNKLPLQTAEFQALIEQDPASVLDCIFIELEKLLARNDGNDSKDVSHDPLIYSYAPFINSRAPEFMTTFQSLNRKEFVFHDHAEITFAALKEVLSIYFNQEYQAKISSLAKQKLVNLLFFINPGKRIVEEDVANARLPLKGMFSAVGSWFFSPNSENTSNNNDAAKTSLISGTKPPTYL